MNRSHSPNIIILHMSPVHQNITTIRVSLTDVNDNKPEFSSSSYVSSILLKDAEKGKLLLTLEATDKDAGDNSRITYRSVQTVMWFKEPESNLQIKFNCNSF